MGVSLTNLIEDKRTLELSELKGKTIAIDAFNTIYQFLSIIRDRFTGEPLRDSSGNITSHLSGLFYRTIKILENGITPVFVFDGEPPEFKRETTEARMKIREEAETKWKEALERGDREAVRRYSQQASKLTPEMTEESKKLLSAMGISWVQAPSEGEAQAAYLAKKNIVYASGSQDWDSLLFGAPRLVRNLTITGRRKLPGKEKYIEVKPEIIELEKVLTSLNISHEQLVILGLLTGTDYNPGGIKGIGPKTALKLVRECKTLDNVLRHVEWNFEVPAEDIFNFFLNPPVEDMEIKKETFNLEEVRRILVDEHSFSEERVNSALKRLQEIRTSEKQSSLGMFLGKK